MRFLVAMAFASLACTNLFGQSDPLDHLIVTSTRLKCSSGYAEISYGYERASSNIAKTKLKFIVIQTSKYSSFRTLFFLSSKVDDVTPPAYLGMEGHTVDLPNKVQIHTVGGGRYGSADSDVTLEEIRAWLDQADLVATTDSLLEFTAKIRAAKQPIGGQPACGF